MAKKKKPAAKKAPAKAKKTPVKAKKASTRAKKTPAPGKKAPKETKKAPAEAKKPTASPKKTTTGTKKTFSVVEFSEMTYLTLKGVNEWLKQGKLKGQKDAKGKWLVDAASLQLPFMEKCKKSNFCVVLHFVIIQRTISTPHDYKICTP
ncbi:MAG: hypothetical protein JRE29_07540 [Deltaproteobacteria bacterium]|nr:hypothetical protein [Deltaproteobacteria bacterium]